MSDNIKRKRSCSKEREPEKSSHLTEEETQLYDRQLRMWGVEAQVRMRNTSILLIGSLGGFGAEVAKNLTLSGIGAVTLADDSIVDPNTWNTNYLLSEMDTSINNQTVAQASLNALKKLNPNVKINAIPEPNDDDVDVFHDYDIVATINISLPRALAISNSVRSRSTADNNEKSSKHTNNQQVHFYYGSLNNATGTIFADFGDFEYNVKSEQSVETKTISSHALATSLVNLGVSISSPNELENKTNSSVNSLKDYSLSEVVIGEPNTQLIEKMCMEVEGRSAVRSNRAIMPALRTYLATHTLPSSVIHEFTPASAILGGLMTNEVLRSLARDNRPMGGFNWCFFDKFNAISTKI